MIVYIFLIECFVIHIEEMFSLMTRNIDLIAFLHNKDTRFKLVNLKKTNIYNKLKN